MTTAVRPGADLAKQQMLHLRELVKRFKWQGYPEHIREHAKSIEVRSEWYMAGLMPEGVGEFQVMLTPSGPFVRIFGELAHGRPRSALLQYSERGRVGTWYTHKTGIKDAEVLSVYCSQLDYGD